MEEARTLCGRDVRIDINGRPLLQAQTAELHQKVTLHPIRCCFHSEDMAHIVERRHYQLHLTGIRMLHPFENCNFYDLDHFTVRVCFAETAFRLDNCRWDDFLAVVHPEQFREHISITALRLTKEEENEGDGV